MPFSRLVRVLSVASAASTLAACASTGTDASSARRERAGFVVESSSWFSSAMKPIETSDDAGRAVHANPALVPDSPWVGTIGVCGRVPNSYEYGLGVCVPNPSTWRAEPSSGPDPLRQLAVGVWLKFDF